jgi:hypothetical protein
VRGRDDSQWRTGGLADQSIAHGLGHRFRLRVHLELLVDVAHVRRDRVDADFERNRRGLVVVSFDEELQEPRFVWGQLVIDPIGRSDPGTA